MKSNVCIIDEILLKVYKNTDNIIISINRKMPIRILTSNNRIIIKEIFAKLSSDESYQAMKVIQWWKLTIDESYQVMKVTSWFQSWGVTCSKTTHPTVLSSALWSTSQSVGQMEKPTAMNAIFRWYVALSFLEYQWLSDSH